MMEIEAMTDSEVETEIARMHLTDEQFDRLKGELFIRAACLGWTGDPLKQPPRAVLAAARRVLEEKP